MTELKDKLKDLHTRLIDSKDGYEQAMERVESPMLRDLFSGFIDRRAHAAKELRAYLSTQHDTDLDEDGSILAAAHRRFLDLKSMLGDTDERVLEEVIRGEQELLDAYNDAIEPATGANPSFEFLNSQYTSLKSHIDGLKTRKEAA